MGTEKRMADAKTQIDDHMTMIRGSEITPDWVDFKIECGVPVMRSIHGETRSAQEVWLTYFEERHGHHFKRVFEVPFDWPELFRAVAYLRRQGYVRFRLDGEFESGTLEELSGAKDVDDWLSQNVWLLNYKS